MNRPAVPPPIPRPRTIPDRPMTEVQANVCSDVGRVRQRNEDAAYADPNGLFFVLADGMGGQAAGEVASAMAIAFVRERLEAARPHLEALAAAPVAQRRDGVRKLLEPMVHGVHLAVCDRARRELDKRGMGTTLEIGVIVGPDLFVAHVGDSRTYLIRDGQATLITRDHTMAQVMVN